MRRMKLFAAGLAVLTIALVSCQKENTNSSRTGPSTMNVKIEALNSSYSLPVNSTKSALADSPTITWDTAQMVISNVKFEAELKSMVTHHDSIEISYKWTGPLFTNLMDTSITFGNFVLQPGFYDQVEMTVSGNREDAIDGPVFYLHGVYSNNGATVPVMVNVFENVAFKTEKDSVEITDEAVDFTSYIQLFLDQLMTGVQPSAFDNATLTDGVIVISAEKNRDIYLTIMKNLLKDHHCYFHFWGDFGHHGKDDHYGEHD